MAECQWIGPEQDPRVDQIHYCGANTVMGKSYCHEHYFRVYQKGTSVNGKRASKTIEKELAEIERLREVEEIENENG